MRKSTERLKKLTADKNFHSCGLILTKMVAAISLGAGAPFLFSAVVLGFVIVTQHID
ncbi:hypothetical protein [Pantoea sp. App145]|uniref:hypothetical protein n=1 Tax=Pantoea sp. App145 TaxID=3071567 RepID=UPI003A7FA9FE